MAPAAVRARGKRPPVSRLPPVFSLRFLGPASDPGGLLTAASLSLLCLQGLLQNVYLVFENSVEDVLSRKGCQQNQGGRCV